MEVRQMKGTASGSADDLGQAFEFLMSLRLRHQFQQLQEGVDPDNFIDPLSLGVMDKTFLKEAFKLILSVQEKTIRKYCPRAAW